MTHRIVLPCAKGSEQVLLQEAEQLGLSEVRLAPAVVQGRGTLEVLYRLCLWSRVASRVLLVVAEDKISSPDDLYEIAFALPWDEHVSPDSTFAVRFTGTGAGIRNTQFGALKVKDAVVDRLREIYKRRPDVDAKSPDIAIDVHLRKGVVTIALDLSGNLHQRGYRQAQGIAPIRETLAATLLYRAQWPIIAPQADALIDPMCGSGTLLFEAMMMAADIAPGLNRLRWGFTRWQGHIPAQWNGLRKEAMTRRVDGLAQNRLKVYGFDGDGQIVRAARENAARLGLENSLHLETRALADFRYVPGFGRQGLIVCNPPYGERLGVLPDLVPLYARLGEAFKRFPEGWKMSLIASDAALIKRLRLRSTSHYQAFNGPLEVTIQNYLRNQQPETQEEAASPIQDSAPSLSSQAQMFANRLAKNAKQREKWARKIHTTAYRVYDQDLPDYAVAIDRYGDWVVLQEYAPPKEIEPEKARQRLYDVLQVVPDVLGVANERVILKTRQRQSGKQQYSPLASQGQQLVVEEGQAKFLVNLTDYLDTGLFLDHRPMRRRLFAEAKDKRVLNLFCYTGSVSVQAALGGASYTTSVDLSQTYLDWAQQNYDLNGLSDRHRLQRGDVMEWLTQGDSPFDLIFCDPPTFSNTKKKERTFDVQQDHKTLVERCMQRLVSRGTLYFSNNYRGFKLDDDLQARFEITEISPTTLDPDFARRPNIHKVWQIRHQENKVE